MNPEEQEHAERMIAFSEWQAHNKKREECPHDEHDHGICLDCGKDIMDDLIGRAELLRDE
jgi:Fe2+ or Zn2+ uptake regulation protein